MWDLSLSRSVGRVGEDPGNEVDRHPGLSWFTWSSNRRNGDPVRMCAANVEGFAYLCFFDDGSWFQVKIRVLVCTEISPRSVKRRQFSCISPYKLKGSFTKLDRCGSDHSQSDPITLKTFWYLVSYKGWSDLIQTRFFWTLLWTVARVRSIGITKM